MGNIIIGHGQNGQLGNGTVSSHDTSGTFVNGGQIRVHVTGITTTTGNFFAGGRHFAQGIGVRGHVGQNDQHVQITFVRQVFRRGESETRGNDTFNGGIIGQVQKERRPLHGTGFFKVGSKEARRFHIDSHGSKHNGKVFFVGIHGILLLHQGSLTSNLSRHFIVGQTGGGENGNFLSAGNRVHDINGGNSRLDHGLGVIARTRINGLTIDIQIGFGQDFGSTVNDFSGSVKGSAEHFFRNSHFQNVAREFALGLAVIDTGRSFKDLHHGAASRYFQHLTLALGSIAQHQIHNLGVLGQLDIVQQHQGTVHSGNGPVFQTRNGGIVFDDGQGIEIFSFGNEAFFAHDGASSGDI
mmetsp:Transcript_28453/g.78164  ORF Transcript_28453/g.78164 Transcript_28453/m.78164 type:complete len:354 (-) Transcript_28453:91-1152(-)